MKPLTDSHCHFSFLPSSTQAECIHALRTQRVRIVAQTLLPSEFLPLAHTASKNTDILLPSLGFHPWHINENYEHELDIFTAAIAHTHFIGEIGLDFTEKRIAAVPAELQLRVLRSVLVTLCEAAQNRHASTQYADTKPHLATTHNAAKNRQTTKHIEPSIGVERGALSTQRIPAALYPETRAKMHYVLSLHAVRAVTPLLDLLEELNATPHRAIAPIIHRFNGTSDELMRLIHLGGYISIHPRMLQSKRTRAYACQVPENRLLLETDFPPKELPQNAAIEPDHGRIYAAEIVTSLQETASALSELRGSSVIAALKETAEKLYS